MRRLSSYIGRTVTSTILVVLLVIVGLDALFSLIEEFTDLRNNYDVPAAFTYVLFSLPGRFVLYVPYAALVGCLIGLGLLAGTSELVVMRAAGISILRISWLVLKPVLWFVVLAMALGEVVTPISDQMALSGRALAQGGDRAQGFEQGFWTREGDEFIHVNAVLANGKLYGLSRYRYDDNGQLRSSSFARSALYQGDHWLEEDVVETVIRPEYTQTQQITLRPWQSNLNPQLLKVLVLSSDAMAVRDLYTYANYRHQQGLQEDKLWLAFWQKTLQPLATISLVLVAISFVFGPLRQVTTGFRVFVGVMVGVAFKTSQAILGPASLVFGFSPLIAVLAPILLCLGAGLWMITRYR
ncbi:LPS export ABC transporter permease LptG [Halioxenophilus sp. WMMB6]|uniref:LPS export ABC transporter permease LptG n=1 Tax=Halioxenophilus sp. WMMB6 TaxID=3073815 RepID=UPI00295EAC2C|nr:LPS export ABC transporter permease LptG [Halioxenophilus sp. WMMB6]